MRASLHCQLLVAVDRLCLSLKQWQCDAAVLPRRTANGCTVGDLQLGRKTRLATTTFSSSSHYANLASPSIGSSDFDAPRRA